ncbi:MAG: hypothetical protein KA239_06315, partial [Bacteroidia bacterium]|nr:hypothetical protein [Bacteroidia bacterium]
MRTIRLTTYMFFIALTTIGFSCKKSSDSTSASTQETIANGSESEEPNEALGNAQDENMPNTMALAAGLVTKTNLSGKIDGKIEASLELYQADDVIRGTITYK